MTDSLPDIFDHRDAPIQQTGRWALAHRLDIEWSRLRTHPGSLDVARSWRLADAPIHSLDDIVELTHRRWDASADVVLAELVHLARHEPLAARIIVQRLMPGLAVKAVRYWYRCDGLYAFDVALPALWIAIDDFDPVRRPRHIAPALISDAIQLAFRSNRRITPPIDAVAPHAFDRTPAGRDQHAVDELADVFRSAREAGVAEGHLGLLTDLLRAGSPRAVARERGVTTRTVRNHRDRAIARVQSAVAV